MNTKEIEQALMDQQNSAKSPEEKKKQQEAEEKRMVYLQSFMTKDAIERCKMIIHYNSNVFNFYHYSE